MRPSPKFWSLVPNKVPCSSQVFCKDGSPGVSKSLDSKEISVAYIV